MRDIIANLLENIYSAIAEQKFDQEFEAQYISAAACTAFWLAFVAIMDPDEQATLASRGRKARR